MRTAAPAPTARPYGRWVCAVAALFTAGVIAASASTSAAAPLSDCVLPVPLLCPTVSTPTIPLPLPTTTASSPAPPAAPASSGASPAQAEDVAASAPFTSAVTRAWAQRIGGLRRIDVRLSLSRAAMVVAILHRRQVPSLVAVRAGRAGANSFVVSVPTRIRAGRYTLKLVLGTGAEQHTFIRPISVPK